MICVYNGLHPDSTGASSTDKHKKKTGQCTWGVSGITLSFDSQMVKGILLMSVVVPQVTVWRGFDVSSHVSYFGISPWYVCVHHCHARFELQLHKALLRPWRKNHAMHWGLALQATTPQIRPCFRLMANLTPSLTPSLHHWHLLLV